MASQSQSLYTPEERLRQRPLEVDIGSRHPSACAISGVFNQSLSRTAISIHG